MNHTKILQMYHNLMIKRYIKNWSITKNIRNYFRTKKIISNSDGQIKVNSPSGQLLTNFIKDNREMFEFLENSDNLSIYKVKI